MQFDYGPMRAYERKAQETGDLSALENAEDEAVNPKARSSTCCSLFWC